MQPDLSGNFSPIADSRDAAKLRLYRQGRARGREYCGDHGRRDISGPEPLMAASRPVGTLGDAPRPRIGRGANQPHLLRGSSFESTYVIVNGPLPLT